MSKRYIYWVILQVYRNIKRPSFYIVLFVSSLLLFLVKEIDISHLKDSKVLLCAEDNKLGQEIISRVMQKDYEGYEFEVVGSKSDMVTVVTRSDAVCGFYFDKQFATYDRNGELPSRIEVYQATDALDGYLVREIVFPEILSVLAPDMLNTYLLEDCGVTDTEAVSFVTDEYAKRMDKMNLSIFTIQRVDGKVAEIKKGFSYLPIVICLLIFGGLVYSIQGIISQDKNYLLNCRLFKRCILIVTRVATDLLMLGILLGIVLALL